MSRQASRRRFVSEVSTKSGKQQNLVARRSGKEAAKAEFSSENFRGEKRRKAKERDDPTPLSQPVQNLRDLLAKKFGAAGGRMPDAVCVHIKFF